MSETVYVHISSVSFRCWSLIYQNVRRETAIFSSKIAIKIITSAHVRQIWWQCPTLKDQWRGYHFPRRKCLCYVNVFLFHGVIFLSRGIELPTIIVQKWSWKLVCLLNFSSLKILPKHKVKRFAHGTVFTLTILFYWIARSEGVTLG